MRNLKTEQILQEKKAISSGATPPQLVVILPLVEISQDFLSQIKKLLENDSNWKFDENFISSPQKFRRRFQILQPNMSDNLAILDVTKVCDSVIYIIDENCGLQAEKLIFSIASQGIPTQPVFVLGPSQDPKRVKNVKKWVESLVPNEKYFQMSTDQQAVQLLRHLGDQKRSKFSSLRSNRGHLLAEKVDFQQKDGSSGTLKITGYIRGDLFNVNRLVHIPGWGDFQLEKMEKLPDPRAFSQKEMTELTEIFPSPELQDDLICENEPDEMEGEQTWPTNEELAEAKEKRKIKVPKGTSEYQASWIITENNENFEDIEEEEMMEDLENEEESESEEEMEEIDEEESTTENESEKQVTFADEQEAYNKLKLARQDEMFPDEVDTPLEIPASERFQKYRGLKSFRSSPWDPKENLPYDYARIFQFENFKRTQNSVMTASAEDSEHCLQLGNYVNLFVKNVPSHLYSTMDSLVPLVVFSMLKHENKMSVVNVAVKRIQDPLNGDAIQSKERLIFHLGYRRFAAKPIFSAHTNGTKHKYERFWRPDEMVVMSFFAPIMYPPANVLVFRELASGRQTLVGTGSLISVTPDRLVIKRAVLSGHPFKIHKRMATVRFMFFNRNDIEWFKPVELRTKNGRRGHIKEPLGTHGHMKVIMDKPITQQDTVLMNLYKRVFPKWTYDPFVNRYIRQELKKKTEVQVMES